MLAEASPERARGFAQLVSWRRVRFTLIASTLIGGVMSIGWQSSRLGLLWRIELLGLCAMLTFGVLEQWPKRLPDWLARWVLQVFAVALTIPVVAFFIYVGSTEPGAPHFWDEPLRLSGYLIVSIFGVLFAPWIALAALVRQKEALARYQAQAFALERSEYERQALDARLRLLQAQVAPHFLFNTLANVQALVESGSPQASTVLNSLIAYLRAAVPRLHEPATTLGQELQLVQAYLELMRMRIPDRLSFTLRVDDAARGLRCPPMTLMTLVENAVRHGIDPAEDGGAIDITVENRGPRCHVRVEDTGVGLTHASDSLGTGLSTLRERLRLSFGADVELRVSAKAPHGVIAELDFPAREATA